MPSTMPRRSTRIALEALPASFREDVERHLAWAACRDPFAIDARSRPVAKRSIDLRRGQILTAEHQAEL